RNGGQAAGVMAERAMFVFGYPTAHEEDASRAVRAALQIAAEAAQASERLARDRGIGVDVRLGVHTGVIVVRSLGRAAAQSIGRLVGVTPRIAAELSQRAGANEVIASGDTVGLLRDECETTAAGSLSLPESSSAFDAFTVRARTPELAGRETLSMRHET